MNRRQFIASGGVVGTASLIGSHDAGPDAANAHTLSNDIRMPNITIREYLCREARRITDRALADYRTAADWRRLIPEKRKQFAEMMALPSGERSPVLVHLTGTVDRPAYRIEKLSYESLPNLHVTANLYVPKNPLPTKPGVLYICGHAQNQKHHYQAHARRFAELGFVCLIAETVQLGEAPGFHHGCYREGWFHWYSRGYSPAAVELYNGIRGLDLLAARPEVNPKALGVTGISGGGASTWWIAAGDERVQCASPVCGTTTLESHIYDRVIDGHCDCMWPCNYLGWDMADIGALIAPRPLLIASADHDGIFPIESIRKVHKQLAGLYKKLGKSENLRLVETPGGHSYHEKSRTAIFSWFLKHLAGKDVAREQVGDADESPSKQESLETLRVYINGFPRGNRVATIHDEFVQLPSTPSIQNQADLARERDRVVKGLKETTFRQFPTKVMALDAREEFSLDVGTGSRFAYTSEEGFRLHGQLNYSGRDAQSAPALVVLANPGENWNAANQWAGRIPFNGAKAIVEPRGTGDNAWGDELNWHLRRGAAWTGRTIASMRVWDVLRGLEALRLFNGVDGRNLSLAARGEMATVALYAALLDGNIRTLILESPPPSQNIASPKDGRGPAIEMLACLRVIDLPHVTGLLNPTEIIIAGSSEGYEWPAGLYERLGSRNRFHRIGDVSAWRPAG